MAIMSKNRMKLISLSSRILFYQLAWPNINKKKYQTLFYEIQNLLQVKNWYKNVEFKKKTYYWMQNL